MKRWFLQQLSKYLLRQFQPGLILTRWDGHKCKVACGACTVCKNYFWVAHAEIEPPSACPYCRRTFEGIVPVSGEEMRDIQVL